MVYDMIRPCQFRHLEGIVHYFQGWEIYGFLSFAEEWKSYKQKQIEEHGFAGYNQRTLLP